MPPNQLPLDSVVVVADNHATATPVLDSPTATGVTAVTADNNRGRSHVEVCVRIRPLEVTSQSNDFFEVKKPTTTTTAARATPNHASRIPSIAGFASPFQQQQLRRASTTPRKPPIPSSRVSTATTTPNQKVESSSSTTTAATAAANALIEEENLSSMVAWDVVTNDTVCQSRETSLVQGRTHAYTLDRVYGPATSTLEMYQQSVRPLVHAALDGYHTAVLAYGQTSTGKTFSMSGTHASPGLIPLAIRDCFHVLQSSTQDPPREYLLRVSYLEVYKEHIRDLLVSVQQQQQTPIRLFEQKDGLVIRGLREEVVSSPEQVLALLREGEARRHVGSTLMNQHSSRSHVILRLVIESRPATLATPATSASSSLSSSDDVGTPTSSPRRTCSQGGSATAVRVSSLSLVDLAGSESVRLNGSDRRQEGQYINKSLMTLGQVVLSLSEAVPGKKNSKQAPQHIPYRDSKLTRLLQPCLSGNAQLVLLCCISPLVSHLEESHNTLKFAARAKRIPQKATIQEVVDEKTLLQTYRDEIEELKAQLNEAREQQRALMEEQLLKQQQKDQLQQQEQQQEAIKVTPDIAVDEPIVDEQEIKELVEAIQTMERLILKSQTTPKDSLKNENHDEAEEGNDASTIATRNSDEGSFMFLGDVEDSSPRAAHLTVELRRIRQLLGSVLLKKRRGPLSSRRTSRSLGDDFDEDDDDVELEVLRAQLQHHEVTTSLRKADSSFLQSQLEEKDQLLHEVSCILEAVEQRQLHLEAENASLRHEVNHLREKNRDLMDRTRPTGMTQAFHPTY